MKKIMLAILLVGMLASLAMASDAANANPSATPSASASLPAAPVPVEEKPAPVPVQTGAQFPHVGTCCQMGAGPEAGGALFDQIFGDGLARRGYYVENMVQYGLAINTASDPAGRAMGTSNYPVVGVPDQGLVMNSVSLMTHKDPTTNIQPRGGPLPGATPKNWSYGWFTEMTYGRNSQAARMYGWEMNWGINQPGAGNSALAAENKQPFFAMQHEMIDIYAPYLNGIDIIVGRFATGIGYEIPPSYRPGPDYFYSRAYEVAAGPSMTFGTLAAFNLMRSQKYGYLAVETGINTGIQSVVPQSGRPNYQQNLRYRTPNMRTKIDLETFVGCGEVEPGSAHLKATPIYRVVSPNCLMRQHESLNGSQRIGNNWRVSGDIYYGKMSGDTNPGTLYLIGPKPTPFHNAFYQGEYGQVIYQQTKRLSYGARVEHFRNPNGYAIVPVSTVKTNFNALTVGPHYDVSRFVVLRPEVRYDFQTNNHGVNAFGLQNQKTTSGAVIGTENHMFSFQMDMLLYF